MRFFSHHIVRLIVLVFFSCYAFSPICLAGRDGDSDSQMAAPGEYAMSPAIVWVHALLSTCLEQKPDLAENAFSVDDEEFLLIKKKRAVVRHGLILAPLLQKQVEPCHDNEENVVFAYQFDVTKDIYHSRSISSIALNRGIAPPLCRLS